MVIHLGRKQVNGGNPPIDRSVDDVNGINFYIISHHPFNIYRNYKDVPSFIPNISNLYLPSFFSH